MSTQTVVASGPQSSLAASTAPTKSITLRVELAGGLELLWKGVRQHTVVLPLPVSNSGSGEASTARCGNLIAHLATTHLAEHPQRSMFVLDDEYLAANAAAEKEASSRSMTVRPGILVMVNEADWALEGEHECALADGDEVVFVSTLHGG